MTPEEKKEVEEEIHSELKQLKEDIKKLKEVTKPIKPDCSLGRITRMDAINNKSINDAALAKSLRREQALNNVLSNLDNSSFGLCSKCKKPIAPMRLVYIPETTFCINCAGR